MEDLGNGASCDTHCVWSGRRGWLLQHPRTVFHGHVLYYNAEAMNVAQRAWQFMSQFTLPPGITTTTSTTTTSTTTTSTINSTTTTTLLPSCPPVPASGCQPALSQKALLKLGKGTTPDKNKLGWKWVSSATVVTGDFGDPTAGTGYALCVYGPGGRVMAAMAPAGSTCSGKILLGALVRTGAKYTNKTLTPDGLLKIRSRLVEVDRQRSGSREGSSIGPRVPAGHAGARPAPTRRYRRVPDTVFSNALVNTTAAFKGKSD